MKTRLQIVFRMFFLFTLLFSANVFSQSFTATYDFASVTNATGTTDPTTVPTATGLTFGSFFSSVGTNPNASGRFSFTGWPTGATNGSNTFTGSLNTGSYYRVVITVAAGNSLDLNSLTFTIQRSATGVRQYAVRGSLDSYAANLPASVSGSTDLSVVATNVFQIADAQTNATNTNTITFGSAYDAVTGTVELRFYGFNAEQAGGSFSIDNVALSGVVTQTGNSAPTATDVNFTGSLIVGQTLTGSYTYTDANGDLEGISTFRWFRADNAAGLNEAAINNATGLTYVLTSNDVGRHIRFGVTPVAQTGTLTGTESLSPRQGPIESATNNVSTITIDNTFTPLTNIDYAAHVGTDVTASSPIIGQFLINDVPGTTDDGLPTILTAITFTGSNMPNVQRLAIYDQFNNEVAEIPTVNNPSFSGLNLTAPSGGSAVFSVRVTFFPTVTDNVRLLLTISNATASPSGSLFAATNAGGAATSTTGEDNLIEVTASTLAITTNTATSFVGLPMTPAVALRANDANGNRDLDYTGTISAATTGTFAPASTNSVAASAGVITFSNIIHAAPGGLGLTLTFSGLGTPVVSNTFDVYNSLFGNLITGTSPGLVSPYTAGQILDVDVTSTGISRGTGIAGNAGNNRYNTNGYTLSTTGIDANDYIAVNIAPGTGKQIDFTNITVAIERSSNGPRNYELRSSIDNYATALWTQTNLAASSVNYIIPLSTLVDVSVGVEFRLYGYNAVLATGTLSIDNISINGSVENTPNPSLNAAPGSITNLNYALGAGPSASQTITVNAANLTPADDFLTVTAPANFEVSTDNNTFASSVQLPYTGNSLTNALIYVRLVSGLSANNYTGSVEISGGGTSSVFVTVSGTAYTPFTVPYFNAFNTQTLFNNAGFQGFQYSSTAFNPGGGGYAALNINGTITAPAFDITGISQVEVSFDGATFGGNTNQTLTLEVSEDGVTYNTVGSITYTSSTFVNFRQTVDFSTFVGTTAYIRVRMSAGTNQSRFRNFYISTFTTWNGASWTNGSPTSSVVAIIDGNYDTGTYGSITAKHLTVTTGDVLVNGLSTISLVDELEVTGGTVRLESGSNLLQQNSAYANTGNITVERSVTFKRLDFVYWGSPVAAQNLKDFSPQTVATRFLTLDEATSAFVSIDPELNDFVAGRGYSIRAPNNHPSINTEWIGEFAGVPHNGTYSVSAPRTNLGFNLLSNPYPSPISCQSFVAANPTIGTLYFWAHIVQTGNTAGNYATWNSTGSAAPNGGPVPNGTIQTGQGFLVQVPSTLTVNFNNGMRVDDHANQFFRSSAQSLSENTQPTDRLWIDLTSDNTPFNQVLLGYVPGATNDFDISYDGRMVGSYNSSIYTMLGDEKLTIQGKVSPVDLADETVLGFTTVNAGNFTLALSNMDGLFANGQSVYIRDYATGAVHNLSEAPYTFASEIGTFNDRFTIVFEATPLSVTNPVANTNTIAAVRNANAIAVNSGSAALQQITVYDITGRIITDVKASGFEATVPTSNVSNQVLLVKIVTDKGTVTKKLAY